MSEKVVILPSFLRDIFMAYRILQWQVVVVSFSFSTLKYFSNVFLLTLFPTGNSVLNVPFSCVCFQTSFLLLSLKNFNQMCWYNFFFLVLGLCWVSGSVGFYNICQIWELLGCYFFRIFSVLSSLLLHGFQLHLLIYWPFEVVSHLTDDYFFFFLLFLSASFHIVSITITLLH